MQAIDSTETDAYGTSKDIMSVKENIISYNIIQRCLTSIMSQKKTCLKVFNWFKRFY